MSCENGLWILRERKNSRPKVTARCASVPIYLPAVLGEDIRRPTQCSASDHMPVQPLIESRFH